MFQGALVPSSFASALRQRRKSSSDLDDGFRRVWGGDGSRRHLRKTGGTVTVVWRVSPYAALASRQGPPRAGPRDQLCMYHLRWHKSATQEQIRVADRDLSPGPSPAGQSRLGGSCASRSRRSSLTATHRGKPPLCIHSLSFRPSSIMDALSLASASGATADPDDCSHSSSTLMSLPGAVSHENICSAAPLEHWQLSPKHRYSPSPSFNYRPSDVRPS